MPSLSYREYPPCLELRAYIRCFWELDADEPTGEPQVIVPDGCAELVLHFGDRFERKIGPNKTKTRPPAIIMGEIRRAVTTCPGGRIELLGVRFQPAGLKPFIDIPIGDMVDRVEESACVVAKEMRETIERVRSAAPTDRRLLLEQGLLAHVKRQTRIDNSLAQRVTKTLIAYEGCIRIDALEERFGVTRRHLERSFVRTVGISPKSLAQVLRFRRALRSIASADPNWTDVALSCGYFDQSHLIRDFRKFTGLTPSAYLRADHPLTTLFHGVPV